MSSVDLPALLADLSAEQAALDELVAPLGDTSWALATPAPGWTIADQIGHLAFFDERATEAIVRPEDFTAALEAAVAGGRDIVADAVADLRLLAPADLLVRWRAGRRELATALATVDPAARLPWYGPPMGVASFATARLMETWAHGQDVADALGAAREPTARLRHIADLGVRTRRFSYQVRGLEPSDVDVHVELKAPDGDTWIWGPDEAVEWIRGPALDFCLVVAQRRHLADTAVEFSGRAAGEWLALAQAFAGPPGEGRRPGDFPPAQEEAGSASS